MRELATCLAEIGLIERLTKAQLKFAIEQLQNPGLGSTMKLLSQWLKELYGSAELEVYVAGVKKAFLASFFKGSEKGVLERWAVENAQLILRQVAIYAGRAYFELGGRSGVPTLEIIRMGAS